MLRRAQTAEELMNLLHLVWNVVRSVGVSSWYNPDSDTCWVAVPCTTGKQSGRPQSCFGEQSVSRLSTMMWQGLLCGICMHPCALPGCELRFVMVTLLALYWLPGDQTRTISNAEVVLSHSWRLSRCPACVLCSLRCIVQFTTAYS
jgi:succinate dehydrogenase/fumarate reductase-like Fe-S protein